ncbi:MAG: hypothetical protein H6635_00065 [Anaerolineales bacterium]|nr:hypothetical protein [Anaerolineales bacterium]
MTTEYFVDHHFENKSPLVREIYDSLIKKIKSFGKVQEEPHKTSIHLLNQTTFAGVATRKDYLLLTIKTDRPIKSSRVTKTEQVSRNRFHLLIKLEAPKEIDVELLKWLKDAYNLSD